jgi:hypothetical protein
MSMARMPQSGLSGERKARAVMKDVASAQLAAMARLLALGLRMARCEMTVSTRGRCHIAVLRVVFSLYAKLLKTYRASHLLCERGFSHSAMALARVTWETKLALQWILAAQSRRRALMYLTAFAAARLKMADAIAQVFSSPLLAMNETRKALIQQLEWCQRQLAPDEMEKIKRFGHLGMPIEQAASRLGVAAEYAVVYRLTSVMTHGGDAQMHADVDGPRLDLRTEPLSLPFDVAMTVAAMEIQYRALWDALYLLNRSYKLGISRELRQLRPSKVGL